MKKLVVLSGGLVAVGSAALVGAGIAMSQPANVNVVGEPYNKALQILKSQGVKATFGGSFGSVLPQAQCLVDSQKAIETMDFGRPAIKVTLMLDCSQKAADLIAEQSPSGGPTVGSNGVTTVTPTPVVPIQGAPGPVAPPPA
ncbi:MAG TPA: hypothetical protein VHI10_02250 [Mycobacterium sp.]|nr:hypothetical protein [Mycobacterium sp.]